MCRRIFDIADTSKDGVLDFPEFHAAFSSKTLNLNLSDDEMRKMMDIADTNHTGTIELPEFIELVKDLRTVLEEVYATCDIDANDWCHITQVLPPHVPRRGVYLTNPFALQRSCVATRGVPEQTNGGAASKAAKVVQNSTN